MHFISIIISISSLFPLGDKIPTSKGDLEITPILHGTFVMEWDGKTIYVDPYGGGEAFNKVSDPDIIIITDIHGDHMNPKTLGEINTSNAVFIVPKAVNESIGDIDKEEAVVIANGEVKEVMGITVEAIPMYNLPETSDSRHPKGRGNGYVLTMGEKRIYISGDTEDIPEMRSLKNIDVAFVCMNLPYTMDIDQAASAVLEFKPTIVYPFHYRGGGKKYSDTEAFKAKVEAGNPDIKVRLRNWYPES